MSPLVDVSIASIFADNSSVLLKRSTHFDESPPPLLGFAVVAEDESPEELAESLLFEEPPQAVPINMSPATRTAASAAPFFFEDMYSLLWEIDVLTA